MGYSIMMEWLCCNLLGSFGCYTLFPDVLVVNARNARWYNRNDDVMSR